MSERLLTDEDVTAIAEAISEHHKECQCRYDIEPEDLKAAINFYKHFNSIMEDSKRTVRHTVLKLIVAAIMFLIVLGSWKRVELWLKGIID